MLDLNNLVWYEISDSEEQAEDRYGNIFTRDKDLITISLYCSLCNNIIATIEDVESMKSNECCNQCKELNYYSSKES